MMLVIATALLFIGITLAFLMVIGIIPANLYLSLLCYISSTAGLFLGFFGIARGRQPRD